MTRLVSNIWDRLGTLTPTRDAAVAIRTETRDDDPCGDDAPTAGGHVLLAPPAMRPVDEVLSRSPGMVDLTGRRFGRLTVIALKAKDPSDGKCAPTRWVCRCDCGNYTLRRHNKIAKKGPDAEEACPVCDQRQRVLARDLSAKGQTKARRADEESRLDALARRQA